MKAKSTAANTEAHGFQAYDATAANSTRYARASKGFKHERALHLGVFEPIDQRRKSWRQKRKRHR